jgi:hypothetical protein
VHVHRVELLVVTDRKDQVPWGDAGLLVVSRSITREPEYFRREVLKNLCDEVYRRSTTEPGGWRISSGF